MIEELRDLRNTTTSALAETLDQAGGQPSEIEIRDNWHLRLRSTPGLNTEGWYTPPPLGIIVAAANPPAFERANHVSFRSPEAWPSHENRLDDETLLLAYASPVSSSEGLIGDASCSLYRGRHDSIRRHLANVWDVTMRIVDEVRPGMALSEVHRFAERATMQAGLRNNVLSVNDASASNIGHTIPWSDTPITPHELVVVQNGTAQEVAELISGKRKFVNADEAFEIEDNIAFSVEPRLSGDDLPVATFHVVVAFENGRKAVLAEFDSLFELFGMNYLNR